MRGISNRKHFALKALTTSAVSQISPSAGKMLAIQDILIHNYSANDDDFFIYLDNDGTTYDNTTIIYSAPITAKDTIHLEFGKDSESGLYMTNSSGNLAAKATTASRLTMLTNGIEIPFG